MYTMKDIKITTYFKNKKIVKLTRNNMKCIIYYFDKHTYSINLL